MKNEATFLLLNFTTAFSMQIFLNINYGLRFSYDQT